MAGPTDSVALSALGELAQRGEEGDVCRLGSALLCELEWRASCVHGWPSQLCALGEPICLSRLGEDPTPISELELPELESQRGIELVHAIRTYCCAGAAGRGRWDEVEAHAVEARRCLNRLLSRGGLRLAAPWSYLCHLYHGLLGLLENGSLGGRQTSWNWRELTCTAKGWQWRHVLASTDEGLANVRASGAELARRLREECIEIGDHMVTHHAHWSRAGRTSFLNLAYGAVLVCWRLCGSSAALGVLASSLMAVVNIEQAGSGPTSEERETSPMAKRARMESHIAVDADTPRSSREGTPPIACVESLLRELLGLNHRCEEVPGFSTDACSTKVSAEGAPTVRRSPAAARSMSMAVAALEECEALAAKTRLEPLLRLASLAFVLGTASSDVASLHSSGTNSVQTHPAPSNGDVALDHLLGELLGCRLLRGVGESTEDAQTFHSRGTNSFEGSTANPAAPSLLAVATGAFARTLRLAQSALTLARCQASHSSSDGPVTSTLTLGRAAVEEMLRRAQEASSQCLDLLKRAHSGCDRRVRPHDDAMLHASAVYLHALVSLLSGHASRASFVLEGHCETLPPSTQVRILRAPALAHSGRPQQAVRALHEALALCRGEADGVGARGKSWSGVQILHNLVVVHDEIGQTDVALQIAGFLNAAAAELSLASHAEGAGPSRTSTVEVSDMLSRTGRAPMYTMRIIALHLHPAPAALPISHDERGPCAASGNGVDAAASTGRATPTAADLGNRPQVAKDCEAHFRLDAAGALTIVSAQYVHARAQLLAGAWRVAAESLQQLARSGPHSLRPLEALGVSQTDVLRQAVLALLRDGAYEEVLGLLHETGAGERPELRMLHADALLCLERPAEALRLLPAPLRGHSMGGALDAVEEQALASQAVVRWSSAMEEARWRNNRACLLMCGRQPDEAELELRRCCELVPNELEFEFNLCIVLWKLGERHEACERWLRRRAFPLDETAAAYFRLAKAVRPSAVAMEAKRANSHASGVLDLAQVAALDRLALRYFEELRRIEEFPEYWDVAGRA